jgi:GNAT superfamily N-acetyltransferase
VRIDRHLVRRVEWFAAQHASLQALAIDRWAPDTGASAAPFDGGAMVAFGPGRYVNRAIGLGLGDATAERTVAALVEFYENRRSAPSLEVSPWVAAPLMSALDAAGFRAERFRNIYVHSLAAGTMPEATPAGPTIALVTPATAERRKEILADGARAGHSTRAVSDEYCDATSTVDGTHDFVASAEGQVAACGSVSLIGDVATLGGAATLPEFRSRGLQSALVEYRLEFARNRGCTLAMCSAVPDGQSAQNLVRLGFQLLYTQVVMTRG